MNAKYDIYTTLLLWRPVSHYALDPFKTPSISHHMAVAHAWKWVASMALVFCLCLQSSQCASFDCTLSMESRTGPVQGAEVGLDCALTAGTPPGEEPVVLYDASLNIRTMRLYPFRKRRTPY